MSFPTPVPTLNPELLEPPAFTATGPIGHSAEPELRAKPAVVSLGDPPMRSAWVEITLGHLERNYALIKQDKPAGLRLLAVVKDQGYGHGGLAVAKAALAAGADFLALGTVEEAVQLREQGIRARMLLLGDRPEAELPWCLGHQITCCVSDAATAKKLGELAARTGRRVAVHLKINTGMNRYGVHWAQAGALAELIKSIPSLFLEGALTHFAQSDEADKTFAHLQTARFDQSMAELALRSIHVPLRHLCNSGGFLDLPRAHREMVRLGLLPLGVFPSSACRIIPGIQAVMSVKARIAAIQHLEPGDSVGCGMRFTATSPRRIAVLPIGYGDGFPRVRNQGCALVHGRRAPLVGGVAMDALTVDITDIPEASGMRR